MKKKALLLALALAGSTTAHAQTSDQPEPVHETIEELEQLSLLFVSFPVTEVDQGHLGQQKIEPEKLSEYLSNRLLCPACREKHGLK